MGVLFGFPGSPAGFIALTCAGPPISLVAAWWLYLRSDAERLVDGSRTLFVIGVLVGAVIVNYAALVVAGIAVFVVAMPRH